MHWTAALQQKKQCTTLWNVTFKSYVRGHYRDHAFSKSTKCCNQSVNRTTSRFPLSQSISNGFDAAYC